MTGGSSFVYGKTKLFHHTMSSIWACGTLITCRPICRLARRESLADFQRIQLVINLHSLFQFARLAA